MDSTLTVDRGSIGFRAPLREILLTESKQAAIADLLQLVEFHQTLTEGLRVGRSPYPDHLNPPATCSC